MNVTRKKYILEFGVDIFYQTKIFVWNFCKSKMNTDKRSTVIQHLWTKRFKQVVKRAKNRLNLNKILI